MTETIYAECDCEFFLQWGRFWSESEQLRNATEKVASGDVQANTPIPVGEGEWIIRVLTVPKGSWKTVTIRFPSQHDYTPCFCKHIHQAVIKFLAFHGVQGDIDWLGNEADLSITRFIGVRLKNPDALDKLLDPPADTR